MVRNCLALATALIWISGCLPAQLGDKAIDDKIAAAARRGDCLATAECVGACQGDETCASACLDGAEPEVAKRHDALRSCSDECATGWHDAGLAECQDKGSEACRRICRAGWCRSQLIACAEAPDYGTTSCIQGSGCLDSCGSAASGDGLNCGHDCVRNMAKPDLDALVRLTDCYAGVDVTGLDQATRSQKLLQTCSGELTACYARGESGDKPCAEGMSCADGCAKTRDANTCYGGCATTLTVNAQNDFVRMLYCLSTNQGGGWQGLAACSESISTCAKSKPLGQTCQQMQSGFAGCISQQPDGLLGCLSESLAAGRPTAAKPFLDLMACLSTQCAKQCNGGNGALCSACMKTKCGKASNACK